MGNNPLLDVVQYQWCACGCGWYARNAGRQVALFLLRAGTCAHEVRATTASTQYCPMCGHRLISPAERRAWAEMVGWAVAE